MSTETHGRFFETLELMEFVTESGETQFEICASGPRGADEFITEICVWVFQRKDVHDAAATEMSATAAEEAFEQPKRGEGGSWTLAIGKISEDEFMPGSPAIALAVALMEVPIRRNAEAESVETARKVILWSQSIDLVGAGANRRAARAEQRAATAAREKAELDEKVREAMERLAPSV